MPTIGTLSHTFWLVHASLHVHFKSRFYSKFLPINFSVERRCTEQTDLFPAQQGELPKPRSGPWDYPARNYLLELPWNYRTFVQHFAFISDAIALVLFSALSDPVVPLNFCRITAGIAQQSQFQLHTSSTEEVRKQQTAPNVHSCVSNNVGHRIKNVQK